MIRLWQLADDGDIVQFKFQVESDEKTGTVLYSRQRQATKFETLLIDNYPENYRQHIRRTLFNMGAINKFSKQYTIAWY
ncbi:hypothetical protein [Levilactobacillus enshiensis]|uniref:hypothetical protein n=1 Tax=Levilactobacillus enshiensis TaxID=2590213 RepID=UPI00117B87A1|nr:hypothetical protein [Levilactobacillus enshiensis]